WRRGFVNLPSLIPAVALTFAGSLLGALTVSQIDTTPLEIAVPVALIAIALYFLFAPKLSDADKAARLPFGPLVPVMGFAVGVNASLRASQAAHLPFQPQRYGTLQPAGPRRPACCSGDGARTDTRRLSRFPHRHTLKCKGHPSTRRDGVPLTNEPAPVMLMII